MESMAVSVSYHTWPIMKEYAAAATDNCTVVHPRAHEEVAFHVAHRCELVLACETMEEEDLENTFVRIPFCQ